MVYNAEVLSKKYQSGLEELKKEYAFCTSNKGIRLIAEKGERLRIRRSPEKIIINYNVPVDFYRGFLYAHSHEGEYDITQPRVFENLGLMADCSRNAVLKPETVEKLLRLLAVNGYTYMELYTEDTYEVEGEPYFGYLRGRYSKADLKGLDDYADMFGIELVPCIQTLAHLNGPLRWKEYAEITDCFDILLTDEAGTYRLIENMFRTVADTFRSRRVNIGMDEAHWLGLGRYLKINGFCNRFDIMSRHLDRVLEIAERYGFKCDMWSDMFYRLAFGSYDEGGKPIPQEVLDRTNEKVRLIYWNYYTSNIGHYDKMLASHRSFNNEIMFAGGAWRS